MSKFKTTQRIDIDRDRLWAILPEYMQPKHDAMSPTNVEIEFDQRINADADDDAGYQIVDGIAVVDVTGVLRKNATLWQRFFGGGNSYIQIEQAVREATSDSSVRGIMLRIDSPGGTVSGGSDAADAIYEARQVKPVVSYISDLGASAAYRLASQSDRIFSDRDAQVGSIGTFAVVEDMSKMADDMGIKVHVVKAGKHKGDGTPGTEVTDEQLSEMQREVNRLNEVFLDEIVRGRNMTREQVGELADGRIHIGTDAQELGLTDGVMSFGDAMNRLHEMNDDVARDSIRRQLIRDRLQQDRRRVVTGQTP